MKTRIVAEVSKNWPEVEPGTLANRFEEIIRVNEGRGYVLESWQMSRSAIKDSLKGISINETIIAVFVLRGDWQGS